MTLSAATEKPTGSSAHSSEDEGKGWRILREFSVRGGLEHSEDLEELHEDGGQKAKKDLAGESSEGESGVGSSASSMTSKTVSFPSIASVNLPNSRLLKPPLADSPRRPSWSRLLHPN